jgi:hypothetical protein
MNSLILLRNQISFTKMANIVSIYLELLPNSALRSKWPHGQCSRSAIAKLKQRSQKSVIGLVTKSLLSWAPTCFRWHVTQSLLTAFGQSSEPSNSQWACVLGYSPFSLCVIHKECRCLSSGDIDMLMTNIQLP